MRVLLVAIFAGLATPALALQPISVPEMDVSAGFAAIALLAGAAAIIREKTKRK